MFTNRIQLLSSLIFLGCASTHDPMLSFPDSGVVVEATFTTMGNMVVAPGRVSSCPGWFWEQWNLTLEANGVAHVTVSNGERLVVDRQQQLAPRKLRRVLRFLEASLPLGRTELGQVATDSDYGAITLNTLSGRGQLQADGANEYAPEFERFYRVVRYLESHLSIPNPYCV